MSKEGLRKNNKTTMALQIVFAAICAPIAVFAIVVALPSKGGTALGAVFVAMLLIVTTVIAAVMLIPFILLLVFCRKPFISLIAYTVTVVCITVAWILIAKSGDVSASENIVLLIG